MLPHLRKTVPPGNPLYKLPGVKPAFNPDFDGNTLSWWDGDVGLTVGGWLDQKAANDFTFVNNPTVTPGALNSHQIVTFDGINQTGTTPNFGTVQPITYYLVLNQIAHVNNSHILTRATNEVWRTTQSVGADNIRAIAGATLNTNPDLLVGVWGVLTVVFNGVNSEIRTNLNAAVTGNIGASPAAGMRIAATNVPGNFCNMSSAYLIYRTVADATSVQNYFINNLMNRFSL